MSASPVINGASGAHAQPIEYGLDDNGQFTIRRYRGTRSQIATQYSVCVAAGAHCTVKQGIGVDELEARYSHSPDGSGNTDDLVDDWEFFANVVEKDILEADIAAVSGISEEEKAKIRNAIQNPPEDSSPALTDEDAIDIYQLMLKGQRSIRVNAPVLRHTLTVSNSYTIKAALTNVGKVISSATLASQESLPVDVLFNLPNDISTDSLLQYGWFKMHPTIRMSARQRAQIEQQWEYGLWPIVVYGAAL